MILVVGGLRVEVVGGDGDGCGSGCGLGGGG